MNAVQKQLETKNLARAISFLCEQKDPNCAMGALLAVVIAILHNSKVEKDLFMEEMSNAWDFYAKY